MREKIYILVLLFVSTSYLFSQTDTSVVEVSPPKKKADSVKYDFYYNDYLRSIEVKKTNTSIIDTSELISILSVRAVIGMFLGGGSVVWNLPVNGKLNVSSYLFFTNEEVTILGLGLGVPIKTKTNNFIVQLNLRPSIIIGNNRGANPFWLDLETDFIYKFISISPGILVGAEGIEKIMLSFGINYKFKGTYRS
jgi:hypothetical protein